MKAAPPAAQPAAPLGRKAQRPHAKGRQARVGRAATLPLVQRQYRDSTYEFTAGSELYQSLLFFEALLPALPPLYVPVTPRSLPPLLVYTDASFWKAGKSRPSSGACLAPHSSFRGALGAVVSCLGVAFLGALSAQGPAAR